MRVSNVVLRRTLILVIAAGTTLCIVLTAYIITHKPASPTAQPVAQSLAPQSVMGVRKTVNAGLPVRLKIPKINVDAAIDYIGLTPQGDLDVPKSPANAAWYDQGPRPGDTGNAVIDGHFGYKSRVPAVFDNLHKLQHGDHLYVEDETGITVVFVVQELRSYGPNEDAADVFRPRDGKAHLNLITCKGTWDKAQESYSARLVVFADKLVE